MLKLYSPLFTQLSYPPPMLTSHNRYPYSPIVDRPDYSWPNGQRLAVYIALNLEHFAFGVDLGAKLVPSTQQPDVLNYAWRDYGNRVGVWRLLDLFEQLSLPAALLVNTSIYSYCPEVVTAFRDRGDEIVAHGYTNSERQDSMSPNAEAAMIATVTQAIADHEGTPPAGWLGPWIAESWRTLDLLREAGYGYTLDWCCDDQPIWLSTRAGPLLSIPYPQELNDIPTIAVRNTSAADFADMIIDNVDEMLEQSRTQPLVCGIALHPYIVGQPFRLRHLRRALQHIRERSDQIWLTHPGAIARHIFSVCPSLK
ncbi:MAG: polysaccharide deacetylase family protein [Leptolyngbyaceae bacterium]|nr:polysaccharide deacetylase family protein [Leptolyngbyaceae bacterium]